MMPPEYDEWVNANHERMAAYARTRLGSSGVADPYELVDAAVLRAVDSAMFPVNDDSLWWSWHCGAMRSTVEHALRASLRSRANAAREGAGAILSETQTRRAARRERLQVHPHTIRRKYPRPRWPHLAFTHVAYLGPCRCGAPMFWDIERQPTGDLVHSLGCWNGHHQYNSQETSMPFVERKSSGGGSFFKWDQIGKEFTGQYVRLGKGSYKGRDTYHAVFIQSGTGTEVKVNAPAVLKRRLEEEFKPGATLYIKYTHDERGNNPQPTKIFAIFEWEADQAAPAPVPTAQPPATPIPVPPAPVVPPVVPPQSPAPVPAAIPLPAPVVPPAPAAEGSEYTSLLAKLQSASGPSYPLMVKMLDSYTTEAAKVEALKLTLRNTFGLAI